MSKQVTVPGEIIDRLIELLEAMGYCIDAVEEVLRGADPKATISVKRVDPSVAPLEGTSRPGTDCDLYLCPTGCSVLAPVDHGEVTVSSLARGVAKIDEVHDQVLRLLSDLAPVPAH